MVTVNGQRFWVSLDTMGNWTVLDISTGERIKCHNYATALFVSRTKNENRPGGEEEEETL